MSSQSVVDRLNAAKHSLAGQGLAKSVCKATTEEVNGPKRKHLDYLLQCTHEANVSVPQLADLLIQRTQSNNWVVVFKSLITVHNVMNYGNERFMQYMASMTHHTQLENYNDRTNPGGYDMSTYIRKYAKYINSKSVSYRVMAFDFCKVKRGKDDGLLRTMNPEKLLKSLPALQDLIDSLLEFDPTLSELNNGVINGAFLLMFKDLIRLFACYNDGIINLLEKYFDMTRKQCKEGLDIYKKFLVRMDKTAEFLKVAEPWSKKQNVGIDKGDIPDLTRAPASLMEALEAHLLSLEGKKAAKSSTKPTLGGSGLSEDEKKRILAEEEKELQKLKSDDDSPKVKPKKAKKKKREQKMKAQAAAGQMSDMQAANASAVQAASAAPPAASHADDLLGLADNPFQSKVESVLSVQNTTPIPQQPQAAWGTMPGLTPQNGQQTSGTGFANDTNFAAVFNQPQPTQPTQAQSTIPLNQAPLQPKRLNESGNSQGDLFGGSLLQPSNSTATSNSNKLVQGDLDSSLASLAGNLSVKSGHQKTKADLQWQPQQEKKLTGGAQFNMMPVSGAMWNQQQQPMMQPAAQPIMTAQFPAFPAQNMQYQPAIQPQYNMGMNVYGQPMAANMTYGVRPMVPAYTAQPMMGQQTMMGMQMPVQPMQAQPQHTIPQQPNDPFGNL